MSNKIYEMMFEDQKVADTDLTPFLGLMTVLVPLLLLTASFVTLLSVGAKVPVLGEVREAIDKQTEKNKEEKVALHLAMSKGNIVLIQLKRGNKVVSNSRVPASIDQNLDIENIRKELIKIKKVHPDVFQARLNPTEQVKYENIVALMDIMRVAPTEVVFPVTDIDSGEVYQTNIMFDDITFGNIMGDEK